MSFHLVNITVFLNSIAATFTQAYKVIYTHHRLKWISQSSCKSALLKWIKDNDDVIIDLIAASKSKLINIYTTINYQKYHSHCVCYE